MTSHKRGIAWWVKLLAVIGLLLCIDSCTNRSSREVIVAGKELVKMTGTSSSRGADGFKLQVEGTTGLVSFFVAADAFHDIQEGDRITIQQSLILGRHRGVEKNGQVFSALSFWNILLFFTGVVCLMPLFKDLLFATLRRLFGRWLPGL